MLFKVLFLENQIDHEKGEFGEIVYSVVIGEENVEENAS